MNAAWNNRNLGLTRLLNQAVQLFLLTNQFDLTADEIGEMYRSRWAIETFFKWMKQHIKIKSFYGTSENAVMNQVWMALIAYCLLTLVKHQGSEALARKFANNQIDDVIDLNRKNACKQSFFSK